ncbi:unnamed protein product [Symbiodinium sp. CCMP2592]|nr:unnamed protein product [Symbiodinium sp. CCMP2592]
MKGKFMDVSQSVRRGKHSTPTGFLHTLTTSTRLYSFSLDRVLTGREMLSLHCQPRDLVIPEGVADSDLRDLAGEGMALPCLASVVWCLYLTKQLDKEPKFKNKFGRACRLRLGEEESTVDIPRPSNVTDFEETALEVFVELGVLTEGEYEKLSGHICSNISGPVLRAEMIELPSQLGVPKKFFLISLEGLGCDVVHGLRRCRVSCRFGIRHEELLLQAAKQLIEGQGQAVYSFHTSEQLEKNPKGLTNDQAFNSIKTLDCLKEKLQKAVIQKAAKPEANKPESDDEPPEGSRKVQPAQSSRVARGVAIQPKRRSSGKKKGEREDVSTLEDPDNIPPALQPVTAALKTVPKCFASCDPVRLLNGERLMRSVDAAARR